MSELAFYTARELAPLIRACQVSPVEVTNKLLERIQMFDPTFRSYITPLFDVALRQAKQAEKEIMQGVDRGPLHGIPIGIKDNKLTEGIRTTIGSKLFANFVPKETATIVTKLRQAGTIMLGKQNMHQMAIGSTGTNPFYGATKNPWNTHYMVGGSSSGAAASLAAGLATLATGTDTFGSIRLPAAMTGVYGLKTTYGRTSTYGVFPTAMSLDTVGPMARSVKDLAWMLQVMAGYDPNDPASLHVQVPNYTAYFNKDIRGLKIGVPTYYLEDLDRDVAFLFERALDTLQYIGAEIKEMVLPELTLSTFAGYSIVVGEAAAFHEKWLKTQAENYAPDTRATLFAGTLTHAPPYMKAQQARRKMAIAFLKAFEKVDVLLGPTIPITTPAFQANWVKQNLEVVRRTLPFTSPINLTGTPALAVPMGLCSKGLPVGMQLIGPPLSEAKLLQIGNVWEQTVPLSVRA